MYDMEEIYRLLGIDASKMPRSSRKTSDTKTSDKESDAEDSIREFAAYVKFLYDSMVDAGFTDEQAFSLVKFMISEVLRND